MRRRCIFFFSSRRRHTRFDCDWSSDVCSSDLDTLYFLRHNQNILSRLEPTTGKPRGEPLRLEGIRDFIFASPVGAAGRIYITGRDGATVVLRHNRDNDTLAVNRLDDVFSASAALV